MAKSIDVLPPSPHPPIHGAHDVSFREVVEDDLPDLVRWLADPGVREFYGNPDETVDEARESYIEPDPTTPCRRFVIEWRGRGVGEIQYYDDDAGHERCWSAGIDIFIGEPEARGRGVGIEAIRVMLRFLFEELRVHRVIIDPEVGNARAIHVYQRAGFRLSGVIRHNALEGERYVDTQYLTILDDEWPAAKARWIEERGAID